MNAVNTASAIASNIEEMTAEHVAHALNVYGLRAVADGGFVAVEEPVSANAHRAAAWGRVELLDARELVLAIREIDGTLLDVYRAWIVSRRHEMAVTDYRGGEPRLLRALWAVTFPWAVRA